MDRYGIFFALTSMDNYSVKFVLGLKNNNVRSKTKERVFVLRDTVK